MLSSVQFMNGINVMSNTLGHPYPLSFYNEAGLYFPLLITRCT